MALNRKYLGIKFPFTKLGEENFFVDMEYDQYKEIKSDLMHLLFTPKGQRLRMPDFGTDLIRYIFEPQDKKTLSDIKEELNISVKKYIPSITITTINISNSTTTEHMVNVEITYDINEGSFITTDTITTTI
jgi:hypothetical protein